MRCEAITRPQLLLIFIASAIPRLAGALWLPNAFGDAYAYTEQIYYMRRALLNGSFSFANLFGFWLPLYQLVCAGLSAVAGSSFYVPKLVSGVCGAGVCVLVCLLTLELTSNRRLSLASAAIVALNPYHIFYSSSAMTDVPHAFVILLCAYCCIRNRWLLASLCGLAACLMRIESWTLVLIIPLVQAGRQRKFSPLVSLSLAAGPAFWLFVSWKASGSFWKYFEIRNNYIVETLAGSPWLASFAPARVGLDFLRLAYTCNPVVLFASISLFFILLKHTSVGHVHAAVKPPLNSGHLSGWESRVKAFNSRHPSGWEGRFSPARLSLLATYTIILVLLSILSTTLQRLRSVFATKEGLLLSFFFSHLAFLLLAYFTRNQPEIWPRYGLIFFTLGLPILATHIPGLIECTQRTKRTLIYVSATLFGMQFCAQLIDVTRMTVKSDPNVVAAEFLEGQRQLDGSLKIYCEDGAIRVLSGIPLEEFRDQYNSPQYNPSQQNSPQYNSASAMQAFLDSLKENQVRLLVYKDLPGSRLREIIANVRSHPGTSGITLEEIIPRPRKKTGEPIIVYRIHGPEIAKLAKERPKHR